VQPSRPQAGKWFTQRRTCNLLIVGVMLAAIGLVRRGTAQGPLSVDQAKQFVQQSGDQVIAILNGADDWPGKRHRLRGLIDERLDVRGMARFALGRFWNTASEVQRSDYLHLFAALLIGEFSNLFGTYHGIAFTVDRGTLIEDSFEVWTTVLRPGIPPIHVGWIVGSIDGTVRFVDVIAEGASLRIAQRDECASFLARNNNNVAALIALLRRQSEDAPSPPLTASPTPNG
jgi:phospholipid transport system substrate-binding protein